MISLILVEALEVKEDHGDENFFYIDRDEKMGVEEQCVCQISLLDEMADCFNETVRFHANYLLYSKSQSYEK